MRQRLNQSGRMLGMVSAMALLAATPTVPALAEPAPHFAAWWDTEASSAFGVALMRDGKTVVGWYNNGSSDGALFGAMNGDVMTGIWREGGSWGGLAFTFKGDSFTGTYGATKDNAPVVTGDPWNGKFKNAFNSKWVKPLTQEYPEAVFGDETVKLKVKATGNTITGSTTGARTLTLKGKTFGTMAIGTWTDTVKKVSGTFVWNCSANASQFTGFFATGEKFDGAGGVFNSK